MEIEDEDPFEIFEDESDEEFNEMEGGEDEKMNEEMKAGPDHIFMV